MQDMEQIYTKYAVQSRYTSTCSAWDKGELAYSALLLCIMYRKWDRILYI